MEDWLMRTKLLLGENAVEKLQKKNVAVFGVGGVGGSVVEALARSGIGKLTLVDSDEISKTNINRQILATTKTVGRNKVDVAKERVLEINPKCQVETKKIFFLPETQNEFDFSQFDYVVDGIDTVAGKVQLVEKAKKENVPIISAMGAGNKTNPTLFEVCDISKTSVCPLARVMRRELKKYGIEHTKVVYSKELPMKVDCSENGERTVGSVAFVPPVVGYILAGEVVKDLIKD